MKVLVSSRPSYGHVYPLMPFAEAARDAGHQVEFATTADFVGLLRRRGFTTHDVGITLDTAGQQVLTAAGRTSVLGPDGRTDPTLGGRIFLDVAARRTIADLVPVLHDRSPDLVVHGQFEFGAPVAAALAGIPTVNHAISPPLPAAVRDEFVGDRFERLWADHGLMAPRCDAFRGEAILDIIPPVLQDDAALADPGRIPMRPVPYAEPGAVVPCWIAERRRPLVYLTLGTVVATDDLLVPVIAGLARLDVDVLLALGAAAGAGLGTLPPNVHTEPFVDQAAVLRHADVAVHHAGSGTVLGALANGVVQVLLPRGADQFFNADTVAAAGLGEVLSPSQVTPEAVASAVSDALHRRRPTVTSARAEVLAMPAPSAVAGDLERIVSRRCGPALTAVRG